MSTNTQPHGPAEGPAPAPNTPPRGAAGARAVSLRSKIVLVLFTVALLFVALDVVALRIMVAGPIGALEEEEAHRDLRRAQATLEGVRDELEVRGRSWAARDAVQRIASGQSDPAALALLARETAELDLLFVCGPAGEVRLGTILEPRTRAALRLRDFPSERLSEYHPMLRADTAAPVSGLLSTERGPLLASSCPIPSLRPDEPSPGRLIVGRFFDAELLGVLGRRVQVPIAILPLDAARQPDAEHGLADPIASSLEPRVEVVDDALLHAWAPLYDVRGAPTLLLRASVERTISRSGLEIYAYAVLTTLGTALLILQVLMWLLQRIVISPLSRLTRHATEVARSEDATARVNMARADEIGQLAREFDGMLEKLALSHEQLGASARLAGMSEIATGVLHNIGNVLNSVNVSATLAQSQARELEVDDLERVVAVLNEHEHALVDFIEKDPRGAHLVPLLREVAASLRARRASVLDELRALDGGVEHIRQLVESQQSYAGRRGILVRATASELLEEALKICRQAYGRAEGIEIVREYEDLPGLLLEKHRVLEILVNLIRNACQAIDANRSARRRLVLRARRDSAETIAIEVEDDGMGIAPENLARVFVHGFTTKRDGHGFGLHVSANAATEMKGSLCATSAGPGQGACFTLRIPASTAATPKAA